MERLLPQLPGVWAAEGSQLFPALRTAFCGTELPASRFIQSPPQGQPASKDWSTGGHEGPTSLPRFGPTRLQNGHLHCTAQPFSSSPRPFPYFPPPCVDPTDTLSKLPVHRPPSQSPSREPSLRGLLGRSPVCPETIYQQDSSLSL